MHDGVEVGIFGVFLEFLFVLVVLVGFVINKIRASAGADTEIEGLFGFIISDFPSL